jgi:hypothetical protein
MHELGPNRPPCYPAQDVSACKRTSHALRCSVPLSVLDNISVRTVFQEKVVNRKVSVICGSLDQSASEECFKDELFVRVTKTNRRRSPPKELRHRFGEVSQALKVSRFGVSICIRAFTDLESLLRAIWKPETSGLHRSPDEFSEPPPRDQDSLF